MRGKIFLARIMSRLFFVILYSLDIVFIHHLTNSILYTSISAVVILIALIIQMGISLLFLKAHSIKNATLSDANYLQSCMDEVMNRSVSIGRRRKKIRLWIADNESINCYTVGQSIVVNKSMLRLGDSSMIEACLSRELSKVYNYDWFFSALLKLNVLAGMCLLVLTLFGTSVVIILIAVIIFSIIFSAWAGFAIGTMIGKLLKFLSKLIISAFYYTSKVFSVLLCRRQELEADRFAVLLGYSNAIVNLFYLKEQLERHAVQTTWIEDLLNNCPSNYRRIAQIEKIQAQITRLEQEQLNREMIIYENPFD